MVFSGWLKYRFKSARSCTFEQIRNRDGARTCFEFHCHAEAWRVQIEIDRRAAVAQEHGAARGALTAQEQSQIRSLSGTRASWRLQVFEHDFVCRFVFDRNHINRNPVGLRNFRFRERVTDVLVSIAHHNDALGGIRRKNRKRLSNARGKIARITIA